MFICILHKSFINCLVAVLCSARQVLIHPSTAEMLSDFIEEKQYQLEQITQIRASPSNFDDRCCASKNSHTPKASILRYCNSMTLGVIDNYNHFHKLYVGRNYDMAVCLF